MKWFAVYTRPQKEAQTAREARTEGFEVFWPHTTGWVKSGCTGKSRLLKRSWLPRYLFVRCTMDDIWEIRNLNGVSDVVRCAGGDPWPIDDASIVRIQARADPTGEIYKRRTRRLKPRYRVGDVIRITDEKSPLFGLYVTAKKVLDNGTVHAMFCGSTVGTSKIVLDDPAIGEVVEGTAQGAQ